MSVNKEDELTFAALDRQQCIPEPAPALADELPLPAWYRSVRGVPLDRLSVEDISKAVRQRIHVLHVVPLALRMLQSDPLVGELYDGELLVALKSVPDTYWTQQPEKAQVLMAITEQLLQPGTIDADLQKDVKELQRKVAVAG